MHRRAPLLLALVLVPLACADEGFTPQLDIDGPALRRRVQRRDAPVDVAVTGSSVTEEQRREGEEHGLGSAELVGDIARVPLTSAERAAMDAEHWPEETFAVELSAQQLYALRRIVAGDTGVDSMSAVFTDDARLASAVLETGAPKTLGLEVTRAAWENTEPALSGADWFAELETWRASLGRVRWVTFLPSYVEFDGGVANVEIDWQVAVEAASGGLRHDRGVWASVWEPSDSTADRPSSSMGWRCRELRPVAGSRYEAPYVAFVDVTREAFAGTPLSPLIPRAPEGKEHYRGIALVDIDADGDLDIVCAIPNQLLLNDGTGKFKDVTEKAGIVREKGFAGLQVADFNRDGMLDIVYAGKRRHALAYIQVRPGYFRPKDIEAARDDNRPSSLTAHDVDGDGWLDLFICGYGPLVNPGPDIVHDATNARNNQLLKGGPNGFVDVTEPWGLWGESARWAFMGTFGDVDDDGDDDLYVANDFGPNVLYRRVSDDPPRFEAEPEPIPDFKASFSMSATWSDLDGDLDLDMYVSNMESVEARRIERLPGNVTGDPRDRDLRELMSNGNALLINGEAQKGKLTEQPAERGSRDAKWAWGTALFDWDFDGDVDIQCVNGFLSTGIDDGRDWDTVWWRYAAADMKRHPGLWVESMTRHFPESATNGWSWDGFHRSVFYLNDGAANFEQVAPVMGLDQVADGRALAMGDIDGDGDMDLVGGNINAPHVYVLRNDTRTDGHFAWFDLVPSENRSPAGASILVTAGGRTQRRDVALGEGFVSQHETARLFGLSDAERIDSVEIRWPDGATSMFTDLDVDARYRVLQEGEALERVELRERNYNATGRLGDVEWGNDPAQIELLSEPLGDAVAAYVTPSPLEGLPEPPHVRAVVLWDPEHAHAATHLEALPSLVGIERFDVVVVTPKGAAQPALPDGLAATHATFASDSDRDAMMAALGRWCGTHHQPWPITVYLGADRVLAVSRSAIDAERVRALCGDR